MKDGTASRQVWWGLGLVAIGLVFLVQNYTGVELQNWWALFILIPAAASLAGGWTALQGGRPTAAVTSSLTTGLVLVAVSAIFLLNLSWSRVWPVLLVIIGVGALLPSILPKRA